MFRRSKTRPLPPLPDKAHGRKRGRLGLYLPFALFLVLVIGWTAAWFYVRGEAARRMDATVAQLRQAGYQVTWRERSLGGYPFRLNVALTEAQVREPSGWALTSPRLEGQAFMHALGSWVLAAPQGLTFTRPVGGPVAVKGEVLHASLAGLERSPPRFSFEGTKLSFTPLAGAQPFALSAADRVELHLRPGPDDQAALLFRVDNGKARLSGLFARIAGERPVSIIWDSILTKTSGFRGSGWPSAVAAWSSGGGVMTVRQAGVTAGEAVIGSQSGTLRVGYDGRLAGAMDVSLRQAPRALGAMADTGMIPPETALAAAAVAAARQGTSDIARARVTFEAGRTTLGPVAIGPSPRVY